MFVRGSSLPKWRAYLSGELPFRVCSWPYQQTWLARDKRYKAKGLVNSRIIRRVVLILFIPSLNYETYPSTNLEIWATAPSMPEEIWADRASLFCQNNLNLLPSTQHTFVPGKHLRVSPRYVAMVGSLPKIAL